jgi:hypothetical protein
MRVSTILQPLLFSLLLFTAGKRSPAAERQLPEIEFAVDVMSVLSKAGCNAGTCHGNLNGKGGLKLSLRGQDPQHDHHALVMASRGRRVNRLAPQGSLLLQKATGQVAHRGGVRFSPGSAEYQTLLQWLSAGAAGPSPAAATVVRLQIQPEQAIVAAPSTEVQMSVHAFYSDGSSRDVTGLACYELSNLNAEVDPAGRVTRSRFGETTLIVRYLQQQLPVPIAFTQASPEFHWTEPAENNYIDRHVLAKLQRLSINPAPLCDDTVFVRRAYLDAIGRLPTADETRDFAADPHPHKRRQLIDRLLARGEFADHWALKWADLLRTEEKVLDVKGVDVFHGWIREQIALARPLDQFVRDLVTGVGRTFEQPAANYYRANRDPATRGETTARLFLGTRLQCAKCHNHPFDRWTQDDYYRWSNLFSQLDYQVGEDSRKDKLDKNEFAGEQTVLVARQEEVVNPENGEVAWPKFLGGDELSEQARGNRLGSLADWLASPDNELFVKSQANFVWYHLIGRGLVDPIDDFRLTNPASHPTLLEALAADLVDSGFDLRRLVRRIMNSRTYQLSSVPDATNSDDQTSFSRALVRRLPAEVILDMQSDVLDAPAEFVGYPPGMRAVQIPGVQRARNRDEAPGSGDRFLRTFGKPQRILACDCERSNETTLKQALVLIGEGLSERLARPDNRLQRLATSTSSDGQIVHELYWTALSRPPAVAEEAAAIEWIQQSSDRRAALEDIAWALLNAKEFLFRR